jgi:hypothetical protein
MIRGQSIKKKARKIIILIKREMKNAFAKRNIFSKNAHTSFRSIERKNEKKIRKSETKYESKFAINR